LEFVALGVLAEGEGPEAVAVAIVAVTNEADVAAEADFFFDGAEIGPEFVVADEAEALVFHVGAEGEGELLFDWSCEGDGFDFPAEAMSGIFCEMHADTGGVDAGALKLREFEERVEFALDFGEGFVFEFDAEAVVGDIADALTDVDDAEVVLSSDVEAKVEGWLMVRG